MKLFRLLFDNNISYFDFINIKIFGITVFFLGLFFSVITFPASSDWNSHYSKNQSDKSKNEISQELKRKEQRLLQLHDELNDNLKQLKMLQEKEKNFISDLQSLDFELELLNNNIRLFALKKIQYENEAIQVKKAIEKSKFKAHEQEEFLCKRLRAIYIRGEWSALRFLFQSKSLSDITRNLKIMKIISKADLSLINQHKRWIDILGQRKMELDILEKKVRNAAKSIKKNRKEIINKRKLKSIYLEKIQNQKEFSEQRKENLEKAAKKLEKWIKSKKGTKYTGKFARLKKRLSWPVRGRIIKTFGRHVNRRFNTFTFSKGILIAAEEDTPVCAVAEGNVRFASWFQGYGNLVIVQHDDNYFSLYGHLSEIMISTNEAVKKNQIIGRIGDTGSDSGFGLYFELLHKGVALNPMRWLRHR